MDEIQKKLIQIVISTLKITDEKKIAAITSESSFIDDLHADSLDTVELMMAIEEEFKCDIPDQEASKMTKLAHVIQYIQDNKSVNS